MITISLDNSFSRIQGLSADQEKWLRDTLSYIVGGSGAYFSGFGVRRRSLLDKRGFYPTGLHLRVLGFLDKSKMKYTVRDVRRKPK